MKQQRTPLVAHSAADSVSAAEPEHRGGLGAAWTRLQRAVGRAVGGPRSISGRAESEHGANGGEPRGGAGLVALSLSGGVLHASTSARRLLGASSDSLRAELEAYASDGCCGGTVVGADGSAFEVHAVRGAWGGDPAWIGMLSPAPKHVRTRADLERALAAAQEANADLERLAWVDALTSLLNRRGLEAALRGEIGRSRRSGEPLAAVLIDCDDFERVNGSRGHAVGDQALQRIARRLQESLRPSDHLGRIGIDEFLVLLPATGTAGARRVAQRIRRALGDRPVRESGGAVGSTLGLGFALLGDGDDELEDVLVRTDASLQRSKHRGENRLNGSDSDVGREGAALEDVALEDVALEDVALEDVALQGTVLEDRRTAEATPN